MYFCKHCSQNFSKSSGLNLHVRLSRECAASASNQNPCQKCKEVFLTQEALHAHFKKCVVYVCDQCQKVFESFHALGLHKRKHRSVKHACKKCDQSFSSAKKLNLHCHVEHKYKHACLKCDESFSSLKKLRIHYTVHQLEYECKDCGKLFTASKYLQVHYEELHANKYKCTECETVLGNPEKLKKHMHLKNNECKQCNEVFCTWVNLAEHRKIHSEKHQCTVCNKVLDTLRKLTEHMISHSRQNKCDLCDKSFTSEKLLKYHYDSVHYKCKLCCQFFSDSKSLMEHFENPHGECFKRKQTGELSYFACKECGRFTGSDCFVLYPVCLEKSLNKNNKDTKGKKSLVSYGSLHGTDDFKSGGTCRICIDSLSVKEPYISIFAQYMLKAHNSRCVKCANNQRLALGQVCKVCLQVKGTEPNWKHVCGMCGTQDKIFDSFRSLYDHIVQAHTCTSCGVGQVRGKGKCNECKLRRLKNKNDKKKRPNILRNKAKSIAVIQPNGRNSDDHPSMKVEPANVGELSDYDESSPGKRELSDYDESSPGKSTEFEKFVKLEPLDEIEEMEQNVKNENVEIKTEMEVDDWHATHYE